MSLPKPVRPAGYFVAPFMRKFRDAMVDVKNMGLKAVVQRAFQMGSHPKGGVFIGADAFGNKYYEDRDGQFLRDRYVVLASGTRWDGSHVPPEWHIWMTRMTDTNPSNNPIPDPMYRVAHRPNMTGTAGAYFPPGHAMHPAVDSSEARFLAKRHESWRPRNLALDAHTGRPSVKALPQ